MALALLLAPGLPAHAEPGSVSRYDVLARGMTVGEVTTVRQRVPGDGETLVRCDVTTRISVNLLV